MTAAGKRGALLAICMAAAGCTSQVHFEHPVSQMVPALKVGVYPVDKVDVKPVIVHEVQPDFPPEMSQFFTGTATVSFTVQVDGKVADAMVVQADDGIFGDAALKALAKWRFHPALVKGVPVPCRMSLPFFFDSPYGINADASEGAPPPDSPPGGSTSHSLESN